MTEQSRKWTRGPWRVEPDVRTPPNEPAYIAGYDVVSDHGTIIGNEGICCGEHDEANAALIAEAGTVANETGLTPRQLAERIVELEAALLGLEVTANTLAYCYERRPENFAVALRDLNEHAALARAALRTEPRT